jgi:nitrite reductase/ring-hydroxylating ferredoxin subunit
VPLLGEKLVAFRDTTGRVGLVQENCPHRGASLYFGRNEDAAIRCLYHGWAFNADGVCIDMPSEPVPFCEKVRMRAYPTHESGGIVWAYLGPREAMTPFRDFGTEGHDASEFFAMKTLTRCNWVDAYTGEGLDAALRGAGAVIDATNTASADEAEIVDFFGTITRNLLAAGDRAGVRHHVLLSIVGIDHRQRVARYAGKREQERLVPTWRGTFGPDMAGEVLLPGDGARLGPTTFDDWLAGGAR